MNIEKIKVAYLEAAAFTDLGDTDQPPSHAEPSALDNARAYLECRNFLLACESLGLDLMPFDPAQIGHDVWLTRNGHGVGFWDRPEVYGAANARIFTAFCKAMGPHDIDWNGGEE